MSSFFKLQLDTTPPNVEEANIPGYVGYGYNLIEIYANEELDNLHEVWIVDDIGYRKDLTFTVEGNRIYGLLDVTSVDPGIATVYIRLYDGTWNRSALFSQSFEVLDTRENEVEMDIKSAPIEYRIEKMEVVFDFREMELESSFIDRNVDTIFEKASVVTNIEKE